jgi:hypothetical protein
MNGKQRTLAALRGQVPDRIPLYVTVVSELAERLSQVIGIPPNDCDAYLTNRISHAELLTALGTTRPPNHDPIRWVPCRRVGLCL